MDPSTLIDHDAAYDRYAGWFFVAAAVTLAAAVVALVVTVVAPSAAAAAGVVVIAAGVALGGALLTLIAREVLTVARHRDSDVRDARQGDATPYASPAATRHVTHGRSRPTVRG